MFQPQPTPYSPFSSTPYGIGAASPAATFPGFQPSGLAGAGAGVDSGGSTMFRGPIFSPTPNVNAGGLNFANNSNLSRPYKMEGAGMHDLETQEALARDFQPALEVGRANIQASICLYSN